MVLYAMLVLAYCRRYSYAIVRTVKSAKALNRDSLHLSMSSKVSSRLTYLHKNGVSTCD